MLPGECGRDVFQSVVVCGESGNGPFGRMTKSEVLNKSTVCRNLENFVLNERSQTQRTTFVWGPLQPPKRWRAEGRGAVFGAPWDGGEGEGSCCGAGVLLGDGGSERRPAAGLEDGRRERRPAAGLESCWGGEAEGGGAVWWGGGGEGILPG